jgi:hypothetical protein
VEKTIYFFRRKEGLSREDFREHYVQVHSPLGLRNCLLLEGYAVNLVLSEGEFDAVTMLWSSSMTDFTDLDKGYAKPEDRDEIIADEKTFFRHPHRLSVMVDEEVVLGDGVVPSALRGGKLISVYAPGDNLPPPTPAAARVIDNVVREVQMVEGTGSALTAYLGVIREIWLPESEAPATAGPNTFMVEEHRWREAPALASSKSRD